MIYKPMSRRTFLHGAGITMALPFLEAMLPISASAATAGAPQRFVVMYLTDGVIWSNDINTWECKGSGTDWTFGSVLQEPLAPYKNYITPVIGLYNDGLAAFRKQTEAISHWACPSSFLSGQPNNWAEVHGKGLMLLYPGASLDQMIAARTPNDIKSLVMGFEAANGATNETYYGSEHMATQISYSSQTSQPDRLDTSFRVFNLLFSGGGGVLPPTNQPANTVALRRKSILDLVKDDANSLLRKVSLRDKQKMDEFFTSIRELEAGLLAEIAAGGVGTGSSSMSSSSCAPTDPKYKTENDKTNGSLYSLRARNMIEMLALAFQCDLTRVSSIMINNEESSFDIQYMDGVGSGSHHGLGHYRGTNGTDGTPNDYTVKHKNACNTWEAKQFGYLIEKLKTTSDAYGPLIDNTLCLFGGGISDSSRHNGDNLPILLAGSGGGHSPGSILKLPGQKHSNFLATIAGKFGAEAKIGLSDGTVSGV